MRPDALFAVWPYPAFAVLVAGLLLRYLLSLGRMDAAAAELSEAWKALRGSAVWRLCLVLLVLGHVAILLFPRSILKWNAEPMRLYLLEGTGFAAGLVGLAGCARLLRRQLAPPAGVASHRWSDTVVLSLLFVGLASGLGLALLYRWGSYWGAMTLAPYVRSLLRARPESELVAEMPFLVQLHVFSAFAALAIAPFTRLALPFVVGLHRCLRPVGALVTACGRTAEGWLRKHDPLHIWSDED